MNDTQHGSLWQITQGHRVRYAYAILAMGLTNLFMFGAPLAGRYAIDVAVERDLDYAAAPLRWLADRIAGADPFVAYLWLSAAAAVALTLLGGACQYLRGRMAAQASESIALRLREQIYRRLHLLQAAYYDTADTGDLVQRASSDVETLRVFLANDVVEIGRALMLVLCVTPILFWMDPRLAAFALCLLPALAIGLVLYKVDPALAVIFGIWYVLILAAITSAVKGVFTVVLYRYASMGALPAGFSAREIDRTFGERKRDPWDINV